MKLTSIQNEVIDSFIKLTEKISNGKTNILDFGSNDMVFYRGENSYYKDDWRLSRNIQF